MLDSLHLQLKTDKRPDGRKIPAIEKVEYINRIGKYADLDKERLRLHDVFRYAISAPGSIERYLPKDQLLYDSHFGKLKQTSDGQLMISKDASVETIAIALIVANKIYGNKNLTLSTDRSFQAKVLIAGSELELPLHFSDKEIERKYNLMREEQCHEREQCTSRFGAGIRNCHRTSTEDTKFHISNIKPSTRETITLREKLRMSVLSKRNLEVHRATGAAMLLHDTQRILLHKRGTKQHSLMRRNIRRDRQQHDYEFDTRAEKHNWPKWNLSVERNERINQTANKIMENLQKELDRTFAYSHIQYINREAAFKKRGGCIDKGHFLPAWAQNDPKIFFGAADIYERVNGERYKEIEFALPNELPFEAQKEIVKTFINRELKDHYHAYAIHDKIGQMSDGFHNVHVHIMFSTRKNDEYEKTIGRTAEKFFSRANPKLPQKGGCPKSKRWINKKRSDILADEIRPAAAAVINEILERYGFATQISAASLKNRKHKSDAEGDAVLAKILDRSPEEHLDLKIVIRNGPLVDELKQRRRLKKAQAIDAYAADIMKNIIDEKKIQEALETSKAKITWMIKRKTGDRETLLSLKRTLEAQIKHICWTKDSYLSAAKKFMTKDEREQLSEFLTICKTKTGLEAMILPPSPSRISYNDIAYRMKEYQTIIQNKAPAIAEIFARLKKQKLDILREQRAMLKKNKVNKDKLIDVLGSITQIWGNEANTRMKAVKTQTTAYKMSDIRALLFTQYNSVKESYQVQDEIVANLKKKVISYERAVVMAESKFTGGAYKNLRQALRKLRKDELYLDKDLANYRAEEVIWRKNGEGKPYKRIDIDTKKIELDRRECEILERKQALETEKNRLEKRCSAPNAKVMIHKIALGIIAKNQPVVKEYEIAIARLNVLRKRLNITEERMEAVKKQLFHDKEQVVYKTTKHQTISLSPTIKAHKDAQTIADALLGKETAVPNVFRKVANGDDTSWDMLTEFAKAERRADSRFREDW